MIYDRCLGIAAARTDLWGGIAVMDLLGKDLLLPITDTLIFGAHLVHFFWYTHFGAHLCTSIFAPHIYGSSEGRRFSFSETLFWEIETLSHFTVNSAANIPKTDYACTMHILKCIFMLRNVIPYPQEM